MILGFKQRFKKPILAGTKIHTIRADKNNRWHAGRNIQMATGVRTKNYDCFKEDTCNSTQRIFMTYDYMLHISVGMRELEPAERELLAKNDGFEEYGEFVDWFRKEIEASDEGDCFSGKIIHWTDFKY